MCSGCVALLSLSHASIQTVVHQRYIKSLGSDQESGLHRLIAGMLRVIIRAEICVLARVPVRGTKGTSCFGIWGPYHQSEVYATNWWFCATSLGSTPPIGGFVLPVYHTSCLFM